jgi:transposase
MTELEQSQQKEIAQLREENRLLRQKLDLVIRQLYGSKSERLDPGQLELMLSEQDGPSGKDGAPAISLLEESGDETGAQSKNRRKSTGTRRPRIPGDLPVVEEIILPEPVKGCPEAWRRIGEEVSEQLDYEPGRFFRRRTVRPKYVRIANREAPPIIAKLPPKLVEGGIASPGLLTHIIISKYCDHLPLYRQEGIFSQRHKVEIPRQTMARWVEVVADWLRPVYEQMRREMFAGPYVEADETPIKYLEPGAGKAPQGYLWAYRVPGGDTLFDWHTGRGHGCLKSFIPENFAGVIQCDAFGAYRTFARGREGVRLAGCWAHARRKFYDAFETGESCNQSGWILRQIQHLYQIERALRKSRAGPALREAVRQSESRPIAGRIRKALLRLKASKRILPKSLLGSAINYALNQWEMLVVYLDNGLVEIDNNLVENAIRPTAIGKKNWLFIGAREAGWRSAVIYSLIESCRSRGIDPYEYLRDILTRLPSMTNWQIPEVTPQAWTGAKAAAAKLALVS